jgi:hypothetical protein
MADDDALDCGGGDPRGQQTDAHTGQIQHTLGQYEAHWRKQVARR